MHKNVQWGKSPLKLRAFASQLPILKMSKRHNINFAQNNKRIILMRRHGNRWAYHETIHYFDGYLRSRVLFHLDGSWLRVNETHTPKNFPGERPSLYPLSRRSNTFRKIDGAEKHQKTSQMSKRGSISRRRNQV